MHCDELLLIVRTKCRGMWNRHGLSVDKMLSTYLFWGHWSEYEKSLQNNTKSMIISFKVTSCRLPRQTVTLMWYLAQCSSSESYTPWAGDCITVEVKLDESLVHVFVSLTWKFRTRTTGCGISRDELRASNRENKRVTLTKIAGDTTSNWGSCIMMRKAQLTVVTADTTRKGRCDILSEFQHYGKH